MSDETNVVPILRSEDDEAALALVKDMTNYLRALVRNLEDVEFFTRVDDDDQPIHLYRFPGDTKDQRGADPRSVLASVRAAYTRAENMAVAETGVGL